MNLTAAQTKLQRELIHQKIGQKKNNQTEKMKQKSGEYRKEHMRHFKK